MKKKVLLVWCLLFVFTGCSWAAGEPDPALHGSGVSRDLGKYKLTVGPVLIDGVRDNASGLAYNNSTKTLFMVLNGPPTLMEMNLAGMVKRKIELKGFDDTEGVVWIEGNTFGVVEERRRNLVILDVEPDAVSVDYNKCRKILVEPENYGNLGLEGIGYDPVRKMFIIVKEKNPKRIYTVKVNPNGQEISRLWDPETDLMGLLDLAGAEYDQATGYILIVSDESKCVVEVTNEGRELSRLSLEAGKNGLTETIPQPEGLTIDEQGNIYICSEPNIFYVFSKTP